MRSDNYSEFRDNQTNPNSLIEYEIAEKVCSQSGGPPFKSYVVAPKILSYNMQS